MPKVKVLDNSINPGWNQYDVVEISASDLAKFGTKVQVIEPDKPIIKKKDKK